MAILNVRVQFLNFWFFDYQAIGCPDFGCLVFRLSTDNGMSSSFLQVAWWSFSFPTNPYVSRSEDLNTVGIQLTALQLPESSS